ncbi:MAG: hypothetical protein BWY87_01555 [Deltaproteobacteria bacterium ADurb.Bin510]|jgi:type II secretion system protein N|nr:MAG: hypothetical protein BWY87_01555 [Deltaproteobacteria bacterium ADurb.Bin510]
MPRLRGQAGSGWARFALTVWVVICLVLFSFMRFPYEVLKGRIEASASQSLNRPVRVTGIKASLPLGIRLEGLSVGGQSLPGSLILAPRFMPLLRGRLGLAFKSLQPDGSLRGFVTAPFGNRPNQPLVMGLEADNLDVGIFKGFVSPETAELLSGRLSGRVDLAFEPGELYRGEGSFRLNFKNGNLPLAASELPFDSIGVKNLDFVASLSRGTLEIEQIDLSGSLTGSLSGKVRLRRELARSRLSLEGEAILPPGMENVLENPVAGGKSHFSLSGTLAKPNLK